MKGIVDRIEGEYVVLEVNGEMIDIERNLFPKGIKEGDIVELVDNEYVILGDETAMRKEAIENLFDDLKK